MVTVATPVGELLRECRGRRGMSQLDLALSAGVSSRHISFLETGRARPSRKMVLRLAEPLELPLRERNALLVAAGFAPVYGALPLDHPGMAPIRRALERVLDTHQPYPAFMLDRAWNVLLANAANSALLAVSLPAGAKVEEPLNVMRLVLHPDLLRPSILNWEVVAHVLARRVQRRIRVPEPDEKERALFEEILAYPDVEAAMRRVDVPVEAEVLLPVRIRTGNHVLSWFSTIATIGTPRDVTLDELSIESLFPADDETARIVQGLAS